MMHYNSMRKYTLALLEMLNDIEIEYLAADNTTLLSRKIPIKYSSREKATIFDEHTTKQLLSGNTNILPRMSLVLSTIVKADTRTTNKFTKHQMKETGDQMEFNYNSVSYEFTYDLVIQCRGMNEVSMIIEQIAPRFNPNYTIRINELPNSTEATSIPVSLLDIGIETEEYADISTNITTIDIGLSLKGNFYPPVQQTEKVKNLQIFNNLWSTDKFQRASLVEWDVVDGKTEEFPDTYVFIPGKNAPTIDSVEVNGQAQVPGDTVQLEVNYTDKDNKLSDGEPTYIWSIISGNAVITTNSKIVQLTLNTIEPITLQVIVIDIHGNQSLPFQRII